MQIGDLIYCRIKINEDTVDHCNGIIYHTDQDLTEFYILVNGTTYCVSKHNITQNRIDIYKCEIIFSHHQYKHDQLIESMSNSLRDEIDKEIIDFLKNGSYL